MYVFLYGLHESAKFLPVNVLGFRYPTMCYINCVHQVYCVYSLKSSCTVLLVSYCMVGKVCTLAISHNYTIWEYNSLRLMMRPMGKYKETPRYQRPIASVNNLKSYYNSFCLVSCSQTLCHRAKPESIMLQNLPIMLFGIP